MIGSTYSRFKTTVCSDCKDPFEDIDQCEVCEKPYCKDCQKYWKICADCGRMGCKCHFDGMYCRECHEDILDEARLMTEPERDNNED